MSAPARARSGRALLGTCLGLAAAAALLWGASVAVWYRVTPAGHGPVPVVGAAVRPSLTGLALLALAGIAALVAVAGLVRRVLAGLLGAVGFGIAVVGGLDQFGRRFGPGGPVQPPPGTSVATWADAPVAATPAPLLAVAGGVVLAAVGAFVLVAEARLPRLGARYAAAGARPAVVDPDRAAWVALDEGRDPTADPDAVRGPADPDP